VLYHATPVYRGDQCSANVVIVSSFIRQHLARSQVINSSIRFSRARGLGVSRAGEGSRKAEAHRASSPFARARFGFGDTAIALALYRRRPGLVEVPVRPPDAFFVSRNPALGNAAAMTGHAVTFFGRCRGR
jgi:hypothetical protein